MKNKCSYTYGFRSSAQFQLRHFKSRYGAVRCGVVLPPHLSRTFPSNYDRVFVAHLFVECERRRREKEQFRTNQTEHIFLAFRLFETRALMAS